jgi:hypothetical protein
VDEGGEGPENHPLFTPQELYQRLTLRIFSVWNYLKNIKFPGELKNHQLLWISPILGKRETRRILGDYLLTQTDIEACRSFEDAVGFGGSFLDEHLPSYDGGYEVRYYSRPLPYDIPLRSLYSRNIENLFSGGRAIGVSHLAFTSTRLMRTGGVLGQAVAIAAGICLDKGISPRALATSHADLLKRNLLSRDVFVIGYRLDESDNLLAGSAIRASSQAVLSRPEPDGVWVSAGPGVAAALYTYPERIEAFKFYVRNPAQTSVTVKGFYGYGETPEIQFLPVPELEYNPVTKRYEEQKQAKIRRVEPQEAILTQPTGTQGWSHYSMRTDSITQFEVWGEEEQTVSPGFEGWIEFSFPKAGAVFPPFRRNISGQAGIIGITGVSS